MAGKHFIFQFFATIFLAIFSLNLFAVQNGVGAIAPQDKMKNFTRRYISGFLNDDQHYNMSKTIAIGMYNGLSQSGIYTVVFNAFVASLSSTQISQGVQYGFCFLMNGLGSTTAIFNVVDVAATAIGNRLKALYNQTANKVNSMKAVPRGVNAVYQQVYRIGAQFESQSNICILMTAAKNAMSAANWATFRKCLGNAIRFSNCGY